MCYYFDMAHIHELIDWTVGAYIVHENKVLIRLHEKYNVWVHVGGHVELNEDPITAIKRECLEEVGLEITIHGEDTLVQTMDVIENTELVPPAHMNIHRIDDVHQHIDLIYYANSKSNEVTPENTDDQWVWLTAEGVRDHTDMNDKIKTYALGALKTLGI